MISLRIVFAAVALFALPGLSVAEPVSLADKLASCGKCHVGQLALTGRPAEEVLESIERIRAGQRAHPPGLQVFEPEELPEITAILTGAKATATQP